MKAIKDIRLKEYDYSSNGFYFVTICTHYCQPYLTDRAKSVVAQFIEQLSQHIKGVKLDYYQIMPTHLHLILILENCSIKLGEIIRRLKAAIKRELGFRVWQPNYYEHVIRSEEALLKIRQYIEDNPLVERIEFEQFYKEPDKSGNYR